MQYVDISRLRPLTQQKKAWFNKAANWIKATTQPDFEPPGDFDMDSDAEGEGTEGETSIFTSNGFHEHIQATTQWPRLKILGSGILDAATP